MQKFSYNYSNNENNIAETKAKEYINKYLKELQRHFDFSDRKMRLILRKIYKDSSIASKIIKFMKNKFSMIKSEYSSGKEN